MDVYQTEQDLVVELQVPKVDPKDLKVTVEDNVLKVEGGTSETNEEKGKEYFRREIRRGSFSRMVSLPVTVDASATKASFEHGVLKITMPKVESAKPKTIEVEVK
jgi:HSP20 family protein